jgi:diketogulonate reductase-like aldo/keto reductase
MLTPPDVLPNPAEDYFNQKGVGDGIHQVLQHAKRSDIFVTGMTTPCVHSAAPPKRNETDPAACTKLTTTELEGQLTILGVEYLDLVLLHGPSEPFGFQGPCGPEVCELNRAQWAAYTAFYKAGKAKAIGVSNFCQSCLQCLSTPAEGESAAAAAAAAIVPAVNQIQLHVGMGPDSEELFSYCAEQGIVVQAYGPLAGGGVITDPLCALLGKPLGKSAAQVGLRWIAQNKYKTAMVVKANVTDYLKEDMDLWGWELSDEGMRALDKATVPVGQQDNRPSWGCSE